MNITDWLMDKAMRMYPLSDILRVVPGLLHSHMYCTTCVCTYMMLQVPALLSARDFFREGEMKFVWLKNVFLRFPMQLLGARSTTECALSAAPPNCSSVEVLCIT